MGGQRLIMYDKNQVRGSGKTSDNCSWIARSSRSASWLAPIMERPKCSHLPRRAGVFPHAAEQPTGFGSHKQQAGATNLFPRGSTEVSLKLFHSSREGGF